MFLGNCLNFKDCISDKDYTFLVDNIDPFTFVFNNSIYNYYYYIYQDWLNFPQIVNNCCIYIRSYFLVAMI